VFFPIIGEDPYIIDIDFSFGNISEYVFHYLLGKIRGTLESHASETQKCLTVTIQL
jgi:hypothetical protein